MQALESIATAAGDATVMSSHHTNKLSRGGAPVTAASGRGATSLVDGVRWQAAMSAEEVEQVGEVITLAFTKSNYSRKAEPILVKRDANGALIPLHPVEVAIVEAARSGEPARAAKRDARETERAQTHGAREAKDAKQREQRKADAEREEVERCAREDEVARAIIAERGSKLSYREWEAEMRGRLGSCSDKRAAAARVRVSR